MHIWTHDQERGTSRRLRGVKVPGYGVQPNNLCATQNLPTGDLTHFRFVTLEQVEDHHLVPALVDC